ncbi:helix-turn-helix domain-containing protein [Salinispora mooreana]|uniref:helix-turn-helix domain-containing protein n=3 Tax=Salinispora mooreana TaxID=999545 RepID=UPI0003A4B110|nr:helix-turn-helix transcriptional regulator [Salinispora mooreana]
MATGEMTAAAFLVAELRRARIRRGWSQEELARAINYSPSMVSVVELGQAPPTSKYLEQFDKVLDTGGLYTRMLTDLVVLDKNQAWSRGWRRIQAESWALRWFDPLHVPGLLQTEAYARAVFESDPLLEPEEVERRLAERLDGQAVLYAERPSRLVGVMDEAVLQRRVGGRKVMGDQLSHLARLAVEHPHVRVQVVPCSADEYPGLNGPFILASMAGGGELAFLGGQIGGQEFDRPADLMRLQRTWEATLAVALPPQESIERIKELVESWK